MCKLLSVFPFLSAVNHWEVGSGGGRYSGTKGQRSGLSWNVSWLMYWNVKSCGEVVFNCWWSISLNVWGSCRERQLEVKMKWEFCLWVFVTKGSGGAQQYREQKQSPAWANLLLLGKDRGRQGCVAEKQWLASETWGSFTPLVLSVACLACGCLSVTLSPGPASAVCWMWSLFCSRGLSGACSSLSPVCFVHWIKSPRK